MQYLTECEVTEVCRSIETETSENNTKERLKLLVALIRAEARRELEKGDVEYHLRDTCETIMKITEEKNDVVEIYQNLTGYIFSHTTTFIDFNQVLKRITMLAKSMERLYNRVPREVA